jgi:DNA-binding protein H-NS
MASINYEKMSVRELTEHIARAQKALANAKDRERTDVKNKIATIAENAGFSVTELFGGRGRGRPVAVKFMNPDNRSETWTGRGRKPNWLVAKLGKGAKLSDFTV